MNIRLGSSSYLTDNFGRPTHYYDQLPFGESMVEHNQSQYYGNQYKFNGKELDAATGMYYYGARYYDPRLSIFISVDPLAEKYHNIGGYVYVANNPINAIDPDGRDFRMIMQRDSRGNLVNINLSATVYLQGNGASQEMANKMNKAFSEKFDGYKNVKGVDVGLSVVYVYDAENKKSTNNLKAGENIFNVTNDLSKNVASNVSGRSYTQTGNTGVINSKSEDIVRTIIHESMHLLGLSDRYNDFRHNPTIHNKISYHSGFSNDIMGGGSEVNNVHYENIINYARNIYDSRCGSVNGFIYSDNLTDFYDRVSRFELRNGDQPNSKYHSQSKQAEGAF